MSRSCCIEGLIHNEGSVLVAQMEGWLLRSTTHFPYFFLVALEAGSLLRAIALLLVYPVSWLLETICAGRSKDAALKLLVFITCAGLPLKDVEGVGRAVLPRFFAEDLTRRAWKAFSAFPASSRQLVSQLPRPFVDSFARNQLGAHDIIAPDLHVAPSGRCLGFLKENPRRLAAFTNSHRTQLGSTTPSPKFLGHLELFVPRKEFDDKTVSMSDLQNPVVFHDGRLVKRPTPLVALLILLWMPVGSILALIRVLICCRAPFWAWPMVARMAGIRVVVKGRIPAKGEGPFLIVSNHRTLLDPIFIALAMKRSVTPVTYSLSRLSEVLSPLRTVRLERDPESDLNKMKELYNKGGRDVVVCPEGTTSREPVLLRFSALFAQVTDNILPVAVHTRASLFHGTTARGFKAMDPFFFLMNPVPTYELVFLEKLPPSMTCHAGNKSRYQVANHVQHLIASTLGFTCTSFTRPDKYHFLVGTDGSVGGYAPKP